MVSIFDEMFQQKKKINQFSKKEKVGIVLNQYQRTSSNMHHATIAFFAPLAKLWSMHNLSTVEIKVQVIGLEDFLFQEFFFFIIYVQGARLADCVFFI